MPHTAHDLAATLAQLHEGRLALDDILGSAAAAGASAACERAFLETRFDEATQVARAAAARGAPLAGATASVKDLFDEAGRVTTAGSRALADAPPAARDAPAVARLKAAGVAVVGRTNMTEFAFSGVGINPHHGTPDNPADRDEARIPGGSSSGAAVSVATGAAHIGLGSDTRGSIRIPAALCGVVGFKNTARLVPTEGAFPLSTTLDTVCAMTRSVEDAIVAHEVLAARRVTRATVPLAGYRIAVARTLMQDALDDTVGRAFDRALGLLRDAGARVEEISLTELDDLAPLLVHGGFGSPESYAAHRELLARHGDRYDPRVRKRIEPGRDFKAWEYIELHRNRNAWIARMQAALAGFDAVASPTVPIVAPTIASVAPGDERDEAFFRTNALLLRNTTVANMLDGCALTLPCHAPGELPVGLMLWNGALRDDTVLNVGLQVEHGLRRALDR